MAIYCEDLFKLSSFRDARLRGGRTGLGRKITWPYAWAPPQAYPNGSTEASSSS